MTTGVLLYCFDTPEVAYHKLAERCIKQIQKHLKLEITLVTNFETFKKFKPLGVINYKLVDNKIGNRRSYRGQSIAWHNLERSMAYEHSPYDNTILMDCDYFVFTNNLLTYINTEYDFLLHNKVHDLTGEDMIEGRNESTVPIVWATVTIFRKSEFAEQVFDLIKHIQQYYRHYRNLYRIKYMNYRNDFAFAIALHQLNGMNAHKNFIPTPMAMLAHEVDVLEMTDTGVVFKYGKKVGITELQDVHIMDKEFVNNG
jgi:hypothetical protein